MVVAEGEGVGGRGNGERCDGRRWRWRAARATELVGCVGATHTHSIKKCIQASNFKQRLLWFLTFQVLMERMERMVAMVFVPLYTEDETDRTDRETKKDVASDAAPFAKPGRPLVVQKH